MQGTGGGVVGRREGEKGERGEALGGEQGCFRDGRQRAQMQWQPQEEPGDIRREGGRMYSSHPFPTDQMTLRVQSWGVRLVDRGSSSDPGSVASTLA